jgi:serine/threonine protein kinase
MIKLVQRLHNVGYVHLDIKSNNLLFDCNDVARNLNSELDYSHLVNAEIKEQKDRELHYNQNKYQFDRSELCPSKMHLIDFGSCYRYVDAKGAHI